MLHRNELFSIIISKKIKSQKLGEMWYCVNCVIFYSNLYQISKVILEMMLVASLNFWKNHSTTLTFSDISQFWMFRILWNFLLLREVLSWIHTRTQAFFYRFVACAFPFFEVKSILPIDRYQNATSKAISLHELKKVQLQGRYTLLTQDSIGHLKTLCMSVLSLVVAMESEWQRDSSSQNDKKTLAF